MERELEGLEERLKADLLAQLAEALPVDPSELPDALQGMLEEILEGEVDLSELVDDDEGQAIEPEDIFSLSAPESAARLFEAQYVRDASDEELRKVAREVLEIDPDSVDAHVVLGELAGDPAERLREFQRASGLAERWPAEEVTRAMPQLRWTMSDTLWDEGRRADAIEILAAAIDEDPEDEIHARYVLASWMLQLGWDDELDELFARFPDEEHTPWLFAGALHRFRVSSTDPAASALLARADERNAHVGPLLLGYETMPERIDPEVVPGTFNEAALVVAQQLPAWRGTSGALPWLRDVLQITEEEPSPRQLSDQRKRLETQASELPADDETWRLSVLPWDADDERTYFVTVSADEDQTRLLFEVSESRPAPGELWEMACGAMLHPLEGQPRRPRRLEVPTRTLAKTWRKRAERLEIDCQFSQAAADAIESKQIRAEIQQRIEGHRGTPTPGTDHLATLPRSEETWSVAVAQPPLWIRDRATPRRPFTVMILDIGRGLILANDLLDTPPDAEEVLDLVARTMSAPMTDEPHLPAELRFGDPDLAVAAAERFGDLGIPAIEASDQQAEQQVLEMLVRQMTGQDDVPLIDTEDITPDDLESLYASAAAFYRAAPWQFVPADVPIKMQCAAWPQNEWHAMVIGQMGQTLGVAIYDRPDLLRKTLRGRTAAAEAQSAVFLHFGEAFEIAPVDLLYIERYGWPIAAPEAYPLVGRVEPGMKFRTPDVSMLTVLDVALRTLPAYADRPSQEAETLAVKTPRGEYNVHLSWESPAQEP